MHLRQTLRRDNARLDYECRRRWGISVDTYKALRFSFRVVGVAIIAAPYYVEMIDPLPSTAVLVIAAFVLGPDIVEEYLTR